MPWHTTLCVSLENHEIDTQKIVLSILQKTLSSAISLGVKFHEEQIPVTTHLELNNAASNLFSSSALLNWVYVFEQFFSAPLIQISQH